MNLFGASSTSNSLNTSKPKTYGTSDEVIRNHDFEDCNCIFHEVSMTDTIMKLAIQYNVTMDSIRKANMIWADSGIYALREVRIPLSNFEKFGSSVKDNIENNKCVSKQVEKSTYSKFKHSTRTSCSKSKVPDTFTRQSFVSASLATNKVERKGKPEFDEDFFKL